MTEGRPKVLFFDIGKALRPISNVKSQEIIAERGRHQLAID
jgi:hypothetical protein